MWAWRRDVGGVDYTPRHGEGKVCRRTVRAALARARLRGRAPQGQDAPGLLSAAGDFERIGVATVDLAELVGARETVRRILLESSALNAILIISVQVRQTAGDAMFRCRSMELQQGGCEHHCAAAPRGRPVRLMGSAVPRGLSSTRWTSGDPKVRITRFRDFKTL